MVVKGEAYPLECGIEAAANRMGAAVVKDIGEAAWSVSGVGDKPELIFIVSDDESLCLKKFDGNWHKWEPIV